MVKTGDKVTIKVVEGSPFLKCRWWPQGEVTGTVQKLFKNGSVAVAVDQIKNNSEDGCRTLYFEKHELLPLEDGATDMQHAWMKAAEGAANELAYCLIRLHNTASDTRVKDALGRLQKMAAAIQLDLPECIHEWEFPREAR